jgi:hypothetical protein
MAAAGAPDDASSPARRAAWIGWLVWRRVTRAAGVPLPRAVAYELSLAKLFLDQVLLVSLFISFLPLTAGQILLNNFLSDIPAVGSWWSSAS